MKDRSTSAVASIIPNPIKKVRLSRLTAQASQVIISLSQDTGSAILEVTDNGIGFDPMIAGSQGGMGLRGMRERAEQIGAKLVVESAPKAGTKVKVEESL